MYLKSKKKKKKGTSILCIKILIFFLFSVLFISPPMKMLRDGVMLIGKGKKEKKKKRKRKSKMGLPV